MRIHPVEIAESGGRVTASYRFETPSRPDAGGTLWFSVDERYRHWLVRGPEPAMAGLVFVAMALGEDLVVDEPVSPRFHYGLRQFMEFFHLWLPLAFRPVRIVVPEHVRASCPDAQAVVCCFSGGVDSFHTLYDHLGEAGLHPDYRPTHLFFAHGFDIPIGNATYDEIAGEFAGLARGWNLDFVGMSTNIRQVLDAHVPWLTGHGSALAASALLLADGVGTFVIPSTNRHSLQFSPCGSNPITDPELCTESLGIVHYGSHRSRIQKILAIAYRAEAQRNLRVCWQNIPGVRNCGQCVKCLKVMMPLALEGVLDQFTVFPPLPPWDRIDPKCFAPLDTSRYAPELTYAAELLELAEQKQQPDLARTIAIATLSGATRAQVATGWRRLLGRAR